MTYSTTGVDKKKKSRMETEQGNMKLPISLIKETGDLKKITSINDGEMADARAPASARTAALTEARGDARVVRVQNLMRRGIGVHHAGLLPIVKEVVEMFFCRCVIKFCEVLLEKKVDDDEDKEEAMVPLNVAVAWIVGIEMDLDFKLLGTACLAFAVVITSFALRVTIYSYNDTASYFFSIANQTTDTIISFQDNQFTVPAWFVSILRDCKTETYNTAKIRGSSYHDIVRVAEIQKVLDIVGV
ncbi:hypothetical protein Syun_021172 [Stephania yunnanensis]|uniref:Beta-galactosidase beta-sandwich domain-containing protein n=1 Tax=Stephania yunnanensis TaxID=152371 RepID=A0AAP0IFW9_9MAGN